MRLKPKPCKARLILILAGLVIFSCPDSLYGRAGGGGGYSRSSGGGSSSRSSGGFGGGGGYSSSRHHSSNHYSIGRTRVPFNPLVYVPSLIFAAIALWLTHIQETQRKDRVKQERITKRSKKEPQILAEILAVDPSFDFEGFKTLFESAFLKIQDAWQRQDLGPVHHFITDGVCERFSLQFRQQKAQGYREHLDDIEILNTKITNFEVDSNFEVLTVEVHASMIDYRISAASGDYISGDKDPAQFYEYWTFIRRRGVKSQDAQEHGNIIDGACPNCGGELNLNQFGKCPSCDILVKSGSHDWVLSEITQWSEWRKTADELRSRAARYRERGDESFSIQHIEDRASLILCRWISTGYEKDVAPLRKIAIPKLCDGMEPRLVASNTFFGDCAVGSVDFLGIICDKTRDYCLVEARWCGTPFAKSSDNTLRAVGPFRNFRSLLVLSRKSGVKTSVDQSLSSAHCPACGAPESDLSSSRCGYCDKELSSGQFDWVLYRFFRSNTDASQKWLDCLNKNLQDNPFNNNAFNNDTNRQKLVPTERAESLAWLINFMSEDARFDATERSFIDQLAVKNRVSKNTIEQWKKHSVAGKLTAAKNLSKAEKKLLMTQLIDAAISDGEVDEQETALLHQVAERLGISTSNVNLVVKKRLAAHNNRRLSTNLK